MILLRIFFDYGNEKAVSKALQRLVEAIARRDCIERPIVFYHVSPKIFNYKSRIVMLTALALDDIGPDSLWEFDMEALEALADKELYDSVVEHRRTFNAIRGIDYSLHTPDFPQLCEKLSDLERRIHSIV